MGESADALIEEILSDARKQAERKKRKAERKAEKIKSDAEDEAEAERERILEDARKKGSNEQRRIEALIPQERKSIQSRAVEGLLEHARRTGMERLRELVDSDEYRDILCRLAVEAIDQMSGDSFTLFLTDDDRKRLGEELAGEVAQAAREKLDREVEVRTSDEPIRATGGLQVTGADGHEMCDETFEARLERLWPRLRQKVAKQLTDGDIASLFSVGVNNSE